MIADRTAIIAHMDDRAVQDILDLVADRDVRITLPPRTGLVMMTVTDSFNTDFHLGEVLVCETRVEVNGTEGYAMVTGDRPRAALARAIATAVLADRSSPVRATLEGVLEREDVQRRKREAVERCLTASTKVDFDLMAGASR